MYNEKNNNNATCNDYNEYHRSKDMEERLVNKEKTAVNEELEQLYEHWEELAE